MELTESSYRQLYRSTERAFPGTKRRQHVTGSIVISDISMIPYLGMKTLYLRSEADNTADDGGIYRPIILFRNVKYHRGAAPGLLEIVASDNGNHYHLSQIEATKNDVLVRCSCEDFFWRFEFYNSSKNNNESLYGRVRAPYERKTDWAPPANPLQLEGACKHILAFFKKLADEGLIDTYYLPRGR